MVFTLYDIHGPHPVGATTFAIPLDEFTNPDDRIIGEGKVKSNIPGRPNEPALKLEEVAFTAFYPAGVKSDGGKRLRRGLGWIPKPVNGTLKGYAHFSKWSYWIVNCLLHFPASLIKIPVYPNAPLLDPQSVPEFNGASWPLVLFSHGLAGNRLNYSHICARLASEGRVVLAFEHKDGSGPYVQNVSPVPGRPSSSHPPEYKLYLHPEDVLWNTEYDKSKFPLRRNQLRFRRSEIYLGYAHFKKFVESSLESDADVLPHPSLHTVDGPSASSLASPSHSKDRNFWLSWLKSGSKPKVRVERDVALAGHSFGGATVLDILSTPPPLLPSEYEGGKRFSHIPITHAIVLDPWMDPLTSPGPIPYMPEVSSVPGEKGSETPRLLVINSEGFTLWDEHFDRLKEVVKGWNKGPSQSQSLEPPQPETTGSNGFGNAHINQTDDDEDTKPSSHPPISGPYATLITLLRAQHTSFSDFGVLVPFGRLAREGKLFLSTTGDLLSAFLHEEKDAESMDGSGVENERFVEELGKLTQVDLQMEDINLHKPDSETEWKKRIVGEVGDVVLH
ncbi:platelet-activating factor acetylhydrolase, isoform II-domain-containing protein [Irpex rosettiformis]|uniref:Platelet-activating factor acetylhydrolase, isoform II-domain-containing protein n=1 Tax=Irpex rosettiformis TaxID=378272 RepID=A0ACB8U4M6_9APHY|nr:platelet-activating factor acetylhydrolase, isoform II-domain-containing protein [Irpex rosettiformis]